MSKKKIIPLGENVLIKVEKAETTTKSGIVIPETAEKEKPQEGRVEARGNSEKISSEVQTGAIVLYKKYSGTEIKIEGEDYLILNGTEDILAVVE